MVIYTGTDSFFEQTSMQATAAVLHVYVISCGGDRSLFSLGHKWGTITSKKHDGLGPSTGVRDGVVSSHKGGLGAKKILKICIQKILSSNAMSAKKLANVGVKNGTENREKLVLHNRVK